MYEGDREGNGPVMGVPLSSPSGHTVIGPYCLQSWLALGGSCFTAANDTAYASPSHAGPLQTMLQLAHPYLPTFHPIVMACFVLAGLFSCCRIANWPSGRISLRIWVRARATDSVRAKESIRIRGRQDCSVESCCDDHHTARTHHIDVYCYRNEDITSALSDISIPHAPHRHHPTVTATSSASSLSSSSSSS